MRLASSRRFKGRVSRAAVAPLRYSAAVTRAGAVNLPGRGRPRRVRRQRRSGRRVTIHVPRFRRPWIAADANYSGGGSMPRSHEGKSALHWPFSQKERGHAAVPSAQRWQGAPISGQSESLAQAGDSAGRQKPGNRRRRCRERSRRSARRRTRSPGTRLAAEAAALLRLVLTAADAGTIRSALVGIAVVPAAVDAREARWARNAGDPATDVRFRTRRIERDAGAVATLRLRAGVGAVRTCVAGLRDGALRIAGASAGIGAERVLEDARAIQALRLLARRRTVRTGRAGLGADAVVGGVARRRHIRYADSRAAAIRVRLAVLACGWPKHS